MSRMTASTMTPGKVPVMTPKPSVRQSACAVGSDLPVDGSGAFEL
jgi:hypothetical protein